MMCSKMAPKAKVAAGPRCSKSMATRTSRNSFSAAADLVVKPSTPPKTKSGEVGKASFATRSVVNMSMADTRSDAASSATNVAAPPKIDSTEVHTVQAKQEAEVSEGVVAAEQRCRQALVEVRGLSGESLLKADFQLSDRVLSVKDRVRTVRSIPLWQQMLSFQGEMLNDQAKLGELNLLESAVFDLVLKSAPCADDMEALAESGREVLTAGIKGMSTIMKRDIMEVRAMAKPPVVCETVLSAALHMLAGLAPEIPVKQDGSPRVVNWSACKNLMANPVSFMQQVLDLPCCIDQGRVGEDRVAMCRNLLSSIQGETDAEKIHFVARCSIMCQQLVTFLIGVVKYYDIVAEFRECFGGATITELKSHQ